MADTHSLIPVPRGRRTSLASLNGLAVSTGLTGQGPAPGSPHTTHRRTVSLALSSGDEGLGYHRTPSRVSLAHTRLVSAVEGADLTLSPDSTSISLDGTTTNGTDFGTDDDDSLIDTVDRIRAPTRSSLNKQRKSGSRNGKHGRRRSLIPEGIRADERLGLSRIPRAAVTHAVSLHASLHRSREPSPTPELDSTPLAVSISNGINENGDENGVPLTPVDSLSPPTRLRDPLSPVHGVQNTTSRIPSGPHGKTSRMIATLQTELEHSRSHLERVKQEVRNCRREIGTLTRRSEDLRETRDRMRSEIETLNNVIARKERMVSDVLARARTAEASVTQSTSERKELEARVKKAESDSRAEVEAATAARAKAESECNALRDLVQSMREAWSREVTSLKDDVQTAQTQMREEREVASKKYEEALALVRHRSDETKNVAALVEEVQTKSREAIEAYGAEVQALRIDAERNAQETAEARNIARTLAQELARLRRFARQPPREDLDAVIAHEMDGLDLSATPTYTSRTPTPAPSSDPEPMSQATPDREPSAAPAAATTQQ